MSAAEWLRTRWRLLRAGSGRTATAPLAAVPQHVGIIMDGNGRWAARRRLPVLAGHREGTRALKRAIYAAIELGVGQLTIYSFSTENWERPEDEVRGLMGLLEEMIDDEVPELHRNGVRVAFIGRREGLSENLRAKIERAERTTRDNQRLTLYVAFNYGGRAEIVDAVRSALRAGTPPEELDQEVIAAHLYAPDMAEPDLIIRTSGEERLSNFLLWESAYSELYFSEVLWPDFDEAAMRRALEDYAERERRYGGRMEPGRV